MVSVGLRRWLLLLVGDIKSGPWMRSMTMCMSPGVFRLRLMEGRRKKAERSGKGI